MSKDQDLIDLPDCVKKTSISGLFVVDRPIYKDTRGFFREVAKISDLSQVAPDFKPQNGQWNHSRSEPNVLRGLHAEGWNKLVYPVNGKIFVAIVDIRPQSETFGSVESFRFGGQNGSYALYIPKGCANSLCVVGREPVDYMYLVDKTYDGSDTKAIAWDDPDLNIQWPITDPIISDRDKANPTMRELFPDKYL